MTFIAIGTGLLVLATALVALLVEVLRRFLSSHPIVWRRIGVVLLISLPIHAFLTVPALLGGIAPLFLVRTRGDEAGWKGPAFTADGRWHVTTREELATGGEEPDLTRPGPSRPFDVNSADGVRIHGWYVPVPAGRTPRAVAVLVHGLWRGGMELEPVGRMFRGLDCDVVIVEMRNHGRSGRAFATFGARESDDVVAVVDGFVQAPGGPGVGRPVILYGVSLGSAAAALAAPRVDGLVGVVLDAPMDDMERTARRLMSASASGRRRSLDFPWPWQGLVLHAIELFGGVDLSAIDPAVALAQLPSDLPVLLIGAGHDWRMPPEVVRGVHASLSTDPAAKRLWICPTATHGKAFLPAEPDEWDAAGESYHGDPERYRRELSWLVDAALD